MEGESSNYPARKVGHIVIHWKIHNYPLAVVSPSCNIISPEFQVRGPQTTKWQLILHPYSQTNEKSFILQLQRLDKEPAVVLATWRVIVKDAQETCVCINGNQKFFNRCSESGSIVSGAAHIVFDDLSPFDLDTIHLQCQLLVSHKEANKNFQRCSDIGLKSLSRDLLALYKRGIYSDVEIRTNDESIRAHKAILQARSPYFKSSTEGNCEKDVFTLPAFNYKAVDKVLSYLYSGKLEFVLGKPSILIYDCAQYFQIKEIKQHYAFDDLFLDSNTDLERTDYVWHAKNLEILNKPYLQSQDLNNPVSSITLRLRLYPKGEDGKSNFLFLLVEILQERKRQTVCIEVGILDMFNRTWYADMKSWSGENIQQIRFEQFADRNVLANPGVYTGTLHVSIKLRVCDTEATWKTLRKVCMNTFANPNETEHSYSHLSNDIGSLFTNGTYTDISLIIGNTNFRVHKCILAARSHGFSMKIREMILSQVNSSKLDIKSEIFIILVNYLYSGILKGYKSSDVTEICNIAEEFTMPTLKIICSRILENKLTM